MRRPARRAGPNRPTLAPTPPAPPDAPRPAQEDTDRLRRADGLGQPGDPAGVLRGDHAVQVQLHPGHAQGRGPALLGTAPGLAGAAAPQYLHPARLPGGGRLLQPVGAGAVAAAAAGLPRSGRCRPAGVGGPAAGRHPVPGLPARTGHPGGAVVRGAAGDAGAVRHLRRDLADLPGIQPVGLAGGLAGAGGLALGSAAPGHHRAGAGAAAAGHAGRSPATGRCAAYPG